MASFEQILKIIIDFEQKNPGILRSVENQLSGLKSSIADVAKAEGELSAQASKLSDAYDKKEQELAQLREKNDKIRENAQKYNIDISSRLAALKNEEIAKENELIAINTQLAKVYEQTSQVQQKAVKLVTESLNEQRAASSGVKQTITETLEAYKIAATNAGQLGGALTGASQAQLQQYTGVLESRIKHEDHITKLIEQRTIAQYKLVAAETAVRGGSTDPADSQKVQEATAKILELNKEIQQAVQISKTLDANISAFGKSAKEALQTPVVGFKELVDVITGISGRLNQVIDTQASAATAAIDANTKARAATESQQKAVQQLTEAQNASLSTGNRLRELAESGASFTSKEYVAAQQAFERAIRKVADANALVESSTRKVAETQQVAAVASKNYQDALSSNTTGNIAVIGLRRLADIFPDLTLKANTFATTYTTAFVSAASKAQLLLDLQKEQVEVSDRLSKLKPGTGGAQEEKDTNRYKELSELIPRVTAEVTALSAQLAKAGAIESATNQSLIKSLEQEREAYQKLQSLRRAGSAAHIEDTARIIAINTQLEKLQRELTAASERTVSAKRGIIEAEQELSKLKGVTDTEAIERAKVLLDLIEKESNSYTLSVQSVERLRVKIQELSAQKVSPLNSSVYQQFEENYNASLTRLIERTGVTTKEISKLWATVYKQLSSDETKVSTEGALGGFRPETLRLLEQIKTKTEEVTAAKKKLDDAGTSASQKVTKEFDTYLQNLAKVKEALLGNLAAAEGQARGKKSTQIEEELAVSKEKIKAEYELQKAKIDSLQTSESVARQLVAYEKDLQKAKEETLRITVQAQKAAADPATTVAAFEKLIREEEENRKLVQLNQDRIDKLRQIGATQLVSEAEKNAKLQALAEQHQQQLAKINESGSEASNEITRKYNEQRQKIEEQYNNLRIQAVKERNQALGLAQEEEAKLAQRLPSIYAKAARDTQKILEEASAKGRDLAAQYQRDREAIAGQGLDKLKELERKYAQDQAKIDEDTAKKRKAVLEELQRSLERGQKSPAQGLKESFKAEFDAVLKEAAQLKASLGTLFSSLKNIDATAGTNFSQVIKNIVSSAAQLLTTEKNLKNTANQALISAVSFEDFSKALGAAGKSLAGFLTGETSISALIGSLGQLIKAVPLVGQVMVAVGASVTVLINQFQDLAKAAGEAAVKQTILTSSTGAGKEAIGGLALQYEKLGGTSLQALIAVDRLAETLGEAAKGSAKATEALAFFGVNAVDKTTGKVTSADKALAQFLQNFRNIEDQTLRTSLGIELFGVRSFKLISTIAQNGQTMEDFIKIAERAGRVLSDQDEKILLKYRMSVGAIGDTYAGLQVKMGTQLAPVLTQLNEAWLEFVNNLDLDNSGLIESIKDIAQELSNFLKGVYAAGEVVIPIISAVVIAFSNGLLIITNGIKLLINGVSFLLEPFVKLAAVMGLIKENSIQVSRGISTTKQSFAELGAESASLGSAISSVIDVITELVDIITLPIQGFYQLGALVNALSEDYLGISLAQKFFTDVNEKNNSSILEAAKKYRDLGEAVVSAQTKLELISDTVKKELEEITRATEEQNIAIDAAYKGGFITQQDVAVQKAKIEEDLLKKKKELLEQELQAADDARKTEINKSSEITRLKSGLEKEITRLKKTALDEQGTAEAKAAEKRIKVAEDTLRRLIKDEDELATAAGESGKKYTEIKKKLAQSDLEFAKNALAQRVAAEQKAAYESEQAWKRYYDSQKAQRDLESIKIGESEKDGVLKKEEAVKQRIALEQEASDKEIAELEGRVAGAKAQAAVLQQIEEERIKQEERAAKAREERSKLDVRAGVSSPETLDKAEALDKEIAKAEELAKAYKKLGESGKDGTKQLLTGFDALQKRSKDLEADFRKAGESAGDAFKGGFTKADGTFVPVKKETEKSAAELAKNLKEVGKLIVEVNHNSQNEIFSKNKEVATKTTELSVQAVNDVVTAQQKGSAASIKQANDYYRGVVKGSTDSTETVKQNEEKLDELRKRKAVDDKRREAELRRAKIEAAFEELNTQIQIQQKERSEFEAYYAQKAAQSGNEIQLIRERTQFEIRSVNETISIKRQELELRRQLSGGRETAETIKLTQELKGLEADRFRINQTGYAQLSNAVKQYNDALLANRQAEFELQQEEAKGRLNGAELAQRESQFKISALQQQISFLQDEIALKQASGASTAELIQLETQLLNVRKQLVAAQNAQKAAQQQTAASTQALYSDLANLPAQASEYAKNITIENAREASAEIQKLLQRNGTFYLAQIAGLQEYATQQAYKAIEAIQKGIAQANAEASAKAAEEARQRTQERAQQLLNLAREEARARADAYKDFVEALKEIDNQEAAELKQHAANIAKIERDKVKALAALEEELRREDIKKARDHYYELQQEAINNRQKILDIETNAANNRFNFLRETILKEGNLRKEQAQLQKDLNQAQIDLRKAREAADADKTNVDLANAANEAQQRVNDITQQLGLVAQQQDTLSQKRKLEESRTGELRKLTDQFKKGEISKEEYDELVKQTNEKFDIEKQYLDDRLEAIQNGDAQTLAELDKAYAEQKQSLEDSNREKLELIKVQNELEAQQRAEKDQEERDERERRRQEIIANAAQQLDDERIAHAERMGELKQQQAEIKAEYENNLAEIVQNTRDQLAEMGVAYDNFFGSLVQGYADIQNAADEALLSTTDFINGADAAASQSIIGKLRDKLAQYGVSKEILDKITPEGLGTGSGKDSGTSSGGGGNSTRGGSSSGSGGRNSSGSGGGGAGGGNSTRGGNSTTGGGSSSDPNAPEFTVTPQGNGNTSSAADREKNRAKAAERSIKIITNAVKVGNYTFQVGKDKLIELLSQGKINRAEFDAALGTIEDLTRGSGTDGQGGGGSPGTGSNTDTGSSDSSGSLPGGSGGTSSTPTVYVPSSASGDIASIRADVAAIRGALGAGGSGGVTPQNTRGTTTGTTTGSTSGETSVKKSAGIGSEVQEESDGRIQVGPAANIGDTPSSGYTIDPVTGKTKKRDVSSAAGIDGSRTYTDNSTGEEISEEEYFKALDDNKKADAEEAGSGGIIDLVQKQTSKVYYDSSLDSLQEKLKTLLDAGKITSDQYNQASDIIAKRREELAKSKESVSDEEIARSKQEGIDRTQGTIDFGKEGLSENKKKKYDKVISDLKSGKLDKNAARKALFDLGIDPSTLFQITDAVENQANIESGKYDEETRNVAGANKAFIQTRKQELGLSDEEIAKRQEEKKLNNLNLSGQSLAQSGLKKEDEIKAINAIIEQVKTGKLTSTQAITEVNNLFKDGKLSNSVDISKINQAIQYAADSFSATTDEGILQILYDEAGAQGKSDSGDGALFSDEAFDAAVGADKGEGGEFGAVQDAGGATPGEPPAPPAPTDDDYINKVFDKFLSGEYDKSLAASALTAGANEGKIKDLKKYSAAIAKLEDLHREKLAGAGSATVSAADASAATSSDLEASAGLTQVEPPKPPITEAGPPPAGSAGAQAISPVAENLAARIKNREFASMDEAIAEYETALKAGDLANPAAKAIVDKELERWMAEEEKAKSSGLPSGLKSALDQSVSAKSPTPGADPNNARSQALKSKLLPGEKLNVASLGKSALDLKAAGDSTLGAAPKLGPATPLNATAVVSGLPNDMAQQVAQAMQKAGQQAAQGALNKVLNQISGEAGAEVNA